MWMIHVIYFASFSVPAVADHQGTSEVGSKSLPVQLGGGFKYFSFYPDPWGGVPI